MKRLKESFVDNWGEVIPVAYIYDNFSNSKVVMILGYRLKYVEIEQKANSIFYYRYVF